MAIFTFDASYLLGKVRAVDTRRVVIQVSTNEDLRRARVGQLVALALPKDHPQLQHKARDRWYVPDPKNLIQVEAIRNKRLLEEFWSYLPEGYTPPSLMADRGQILPGLIPPRPKIPKNRKLREVRTEAVRVGFKHCYQQKDYQTILAVAEMLPESILNEDEQLQMIYDNATMRSGVET